MNVIASAKEHLTGLVSRIVDGAPDSGVRQTVTVGCPVAAAAELWRDPDRLSVLLGDLGEVRFTAPDRYRWTLHAGETALHWESRLTAQDGVLRFADDAGHRITIGLRAAPRRLGTEMTLQADLPGPGLLAGAAAFAVLYRARALLQTGEVPTTAQNPSARPSAR